MPRDGVNEQSTPASPITLAAGSLFETPAEAAGPYGIGGGVGIGIGIGGGVPGARQLGRGIGFSGLWGYRSPSSLYGLGYIPVPPYFALHPPVYYGDRLHRSYGLSPFAWPGHAGISERPAPRMIVNQHIPSPKEAAPKADEATAEQTAARPAPQLIHNPYFQGNDSEALVGIR